MLIKNVKKKQKEIKNIISYKSNHPVNSFFKPFSSKNVFNASAPCSVTAFPRLGGHKNVIIKYTPSCTLNVGRSIDLHPILIPSSFSFSTSLSPYVFLPAAGDTGGIRVLLWWMRSVVYLFVPKWDASIAAWFIARCETLMRFGSEKKSKEGLPLWVHSREPMCTLSARMASKGIVTRRRIISESFISIRDDGSIFNRV